MAAPSFRTSRSATVSFTLFNVNSTDYKQRFSLLVQFIIDFIEQFKKIFLQIEKNQMNFNSLNKLISIDGFRGDKLIQMSNQIHRTNLTFVDD